MNNRALNRAMLARQLLLERRQLPVATAISTLAGMQAQLPNPPYYGLWSRIEGFTPADLSNLVTSREVVRIALMRSTIHLVTVADCLDWTLLLHPVQERGFATGYGKMLAGVDIAEVTEAARSIVDAVPHTYKDLGTKLAQRWPDANPQALAMAARTFLALVQVPPRGLWGSSGQADRTSGGERKRSPAWHTTAEHWLGRPLRTDSTLGDMLLRYFAAYGPATVKDAQTWCGLTKLREVVQRLDLIELPGGLFDVPDGPRPDEETPAPVRFLGEWDNMLLSYAERGRIIDPAHKKRIYTVNGVMPAPFLVDGFVAGIWKLARKKDSATLTIEPFGKLSTTDVDELQEEGARLLEFAAPDATSREVRAY